MKYQNSYSTVEFNPIYRPHKHERIEDFYRFEFYAFVVGLILVFSLIAACCMLDSSHAEAIEIIENQNITKHENNNAEIKFFKGRTTDDVNIRNIPSLNGDVVDVAYTGTTFQCREFDYNWYQIRYNGNIAYVNRYYVEIDKNIDSEFVSLSYDETYD